MKKIKLTGKLSLNKQTVTKLNDAQMDSLKGGIWGSWFRSQFWNCPTDNCPPPATTPAAGCPPVVTAGCNMTNTPTACMSGCPGQICP